MFQSSPFSKIPLFCLLSLVAIRGTADETDPTITVTASDEVSVVPNEVELRFGVESRAEELKLAAAENATKIGEVMSYLVSMDVRERDIQTEVLKIQPIFGATGKSRPSKLQMQDPFANQPVQQEAGKVSDPLKPSGYLVRRALRVTLTDMKRFESVYQGLIERGVNQVDSISFRSTARRENQELARLKAIRVARARAEALAAELGAELAGVQSIVAMGSGGSSDPFSMGPFGGETDSDGSIAAGTIRYSASVNVVFRLKSTDF